MDYRSKSVLFHIRLTETEIDRLNADKSIVECALASEGAGELIDCDSHKYRHWPEPEKRDINDVHKYCVGRMIIQHINFSFPIHFQLNPTFDLIHSNHRMTE